MYKLLLIAFGSVTLLSTEPLSYTNNTTTEIKQPQTEMLVGKINRKQLTEGQYGEWFNPRYEAYDVNEKAANKLDDLLEGVDITIFMGTWCGDSKRETPNVYKIFDAANVSKGQVTLIAVTHAKTTPSGLENGKNIQRVPTIIFEKNGEELGRIVEYPIESLENDMLKILQGEEYKHAYSK